ncbi:putative nuclear factor related to kappa-B-binding protein [Lupinus albus]|uniref:Putative nuclear factor related to kappa-B-binding protein n=1 Tax=Lupinus albus TaxID=3870 RepID=A0A6A4MYT6_LUPAL|nr:putative nuclear factor related to kappa-B-binding protein [Lupinus albus]
MAIEKNNFKVPRLDSECSPRSREAMSSDEDEVRGHNSAVESDDDDEFDDVDSGAGSDDFDLLQWGETNAEFCQIGNQTFSIPLELYDLDGLNDILSVDVWNECLSEEERFELAKYLPDMDQENFVRTLKELFTGCNLHFGSPIKRLFVMLKGGLCDPRVARYREGLSFIQKRQHYHLLRKHQNNMVSNLCQIRDAWFNCRGYSIEERLRVLNIMKSQKSLMHEKMEDLEVDSSDEESGEGRWSRRNRNKDRNAAKKIGRVPFPGVGSGLEFDPRQQHSVAMEQEKYGKQIPKGILRLAGSKASSAKDSTGHLSSIYHALDMNPGLKGSGTALSQQNKSGSLLRVRDQLMNGDDDEMSYGLNVHRDLGRNLMDKSGVMRVGKRHDLLRRDEVDTDNLVGLPLSLKGDLLHGYNINTNQFSDMKMFTAKPSSKRGSYDFPRKAKYPENVQQSVGNDQVRSRLRGSQMPLKGNLAGSSDYNELFYNNKTPAEDYGMDSTSKYDDWNSKSNKWKPGRDSSGLSYAAYRSSSPQVSDRLPSSDYRAKSLQEKSRGSFIQNGGNTTKPLKGTQMFLRGEETESDSSEQLNGDDDDDNPLSQSKFAYFMGPADGSRKKTLKSQLDPKKAKFVRTDVKAHALTQSKKKGGFSDLGHVHGVESYLSKGKQKGKIRSGGPLHNPTGKIMEESYPSESDMLSDDDDYWRQLYKIGKNGRMQGEPVEKLDRPLSSAYAAERKKKGKTVHDHFIPRPKYVHDVVGDEDVSLEKQLLMDDNGLGQSRAKKKGQKYVAYKGDQSEGSEAPLHGCNSATKKRKAAELGGDKDANLLSHTLTQNDSISLKRKSKKKPESEMVISEIENSELPITDMGTADMELKTKPQKKQFTLITPTVHTGFSFSIIHLLSAVRTAMISPFAEESLEVGKPREEENKAQGDSVNGVPSNDKVAGNFEPASDQPNMPSLTVQEIVNRIRSNPCDPCILETQEPLQDLVRGVLKIFSSKTAPLGAKGWKALTVYGKSTRSWSWIGPVLHNSPDHRTVEEVTSPEAWSLPHKMLVKLVDSFANWLKCGQETLQQIGSLPEPPLALMQVNLDEKERFRDLRAQKSLNTISPSSEEVRAYFRKEEVLRYSIPDRAFSYTAADGKKSIVAPLRRCGGKPTSKARDHFMLKRDRPPHVTILCLVRDAASRLPGSIGTRADVCTLIRDSQYMVEDVSDAQINQVVSGALDRLHYERDPCVQFDGERKLWVYLHREREEEDFEDDGTSSTKKWKRQKKDGADQSDQGTVTVAQPGTGEQSGVDLCSDLNADPPGVNEDKGMEHLSNDTRLNNAEDLVYINNAEDLVDVNHVSEDANVCEGNSMAWEALGLNPPPEICQENSTNEEFDDESFGRERPSGLQSASLV